MMIYKDQICPLRDKDQTARSPRSARDDTEKRAPPAMTGKEGRHCEESRSRRDDAAISPFLDNREIATLPLVARVDTEKSSPPAMTGKEGRHCEESRRGHLGTHPFLGGDVSLLPPSHLFKSLQKFIS